MNRTIMLYGPEDRRHINTCMIYFKDVMALEISQTQEIEEILFAHALDRILLLMSVDLLHFLIFDAPQIYKRLRQLGAENVMVIIQLRACAWPAYFPRCAALPHDQKTLTAFRLKRRECIYQQITAELQGEEEQASVSAGQA